MRSLRTTKRLSLDSNHRDEFGGVPMAERRGIVLIVVLVLVVMVALAGFAFVGTMSTEYQAVKTSGDAMQAKQSLASAELMLRQFSQLPLAQQLSFGGMTENPQLFRGVFFG